MPQTSKIVPHPETGQPVREITNTAFEEVIRDQLENDVNQGQERVNALQTEVENKQKELSEAQAALEDSKSNLTRYDEIAPQPTPDQGAEGTSDQGEAQTQEGEVSVPVSVEEAPQF